VAGLRICPGCGAALGTWRRTCPDCARSVATSTDVPRPAIRDDPKRLGKLIETLDPAPRPPSRPKPRRALKRGGVLFVVLIAVLVLLAVAEFPLQVVAACAIVFVLFGGVYVVITR
jgi:hypothetical protein